MKLTITENNKDRNNDFIKYVSNTIINKLDGICNIIGLLIDDAIILDDVDDSTKILDALNEINSMTTSLDEFVENQIVDKYM